MAVHKIWVSNYRSFDHEGVEVSLRPSLNLLIGRNNAGKSNFLRFLNLIGNPKFVRAIRNADFRQNIRVDLDMNDEDWRDYNSNTPIRFSLFISPDADLVNACLGKIPISAESENVYVTYELFRNSDGLLLRAVSSFLQEIPEGAIREFETAHAHNHGGASGGSIDEARLRAANSLRIQQYAQFPCVEYMDEYRKATQDKELRVKLNTVVNPNYRNQQELKKKQQLCGYFKEVFGFDVDVRIPSIDEEIELVIEGKSVPLTSLGTGLQEMVFIAFKVVATQAHIVCIDEPELHLHPGAQRELLNLVASIPDKTFFFATHSNHFLDYDVPQKSVLRFDKVADGTRITSIDTNHGIRDLLSDLGIRASEIYQTNGIIWVEGPSDRVYIKHWLELIDPSLKEGLQYTFQYYGGKLLNNYSAGDDEFTEYIRMLDVNRNAYVVMDSDMKSAFTNTDLRDTKQRIIAECATAGIGCWVTEGKEMENYLPDTVLSQLGKLKGERNIYATLDGYCDGFDSKKKVPFARAAVSYFTKETLLADESLLRHVEDMVRVIRNWNT